MGIDRNKMLILGGIGVSIILVVFLFIFTLFIRGEDDDPYMVVANLEFWGVLDEGSAYENILNSFKNVYPNVTINYTRIPEQNYEERILEAMALGQGPDVYMIKNSDATRHQNRITSLPTSYYSLISLRRHFPDIVERDMLNENVIYGLPLYIDTLSLIYNQDIFNQVGVVFPPQTWDAITNLVPNITLTNENDNVVRSTVAMGRADNIKNAKDLIYNLLLQSDMRPPITATNIRESLNFFMSFSNPSSLNYSWDGSMAESLTSFQEGSLAMLVGYESDLSEIRRRSPNINTGVSTVPLLSTNNPAVLGQYWAHTVSHQTNYPQIAWDFIIHMTTNKEVARYYMNETTRPPAHRDLIQEKIGDPYFDVFVRQALFARSWPENNYKRSTEVFTRNIQNIISGDASLNQASSNIAREL